VRTVSHVDDDLKARLLKPRLAEADVDVPGIGTVRVRALNRIEAMHVQSAKGNEAIERRMLALGMVEPAMTEAEVGQWQKASPAGELEAVTEKITELSALGGDADKEAYKSVRGEPGPRVPVLPGAETGHDGGQPPNGDE